MVFLQFAFSLIVLFVLQVIVKSFILPTPVWRSEDDDSSSDNSSDKQTRSEFLEYHGKVNRIWLGVTREVSEYHRVKILTRW